MMSGAGGNELQFSPRPRMMKRKTKWAVKQPEIGWQAAIDCWESTGLLAGL